jgi:hypothetical protein
MCNLTDEFKAYGVVQKEFFEAPPKRQLLVEKFPDYARTFEIEAYWILKYNNLLVLDEKSFMSITSIKIDGKRYVAHYWPEENGKFEIMLQEIYEQFKVII